MSEQHDVPQEQLPDPLPEGQEPPQWSAQSPEQQARANDAREASADSPSDHETPGANPVNTQQDQSAVSEPTPNAEQTADEAQDDQHS